MNEKTNGNGNGDNGKINNTQRRILSQLAVDLLDKKIQRARDESGDLVAQIRQKVKEKLGFSKYNNDTLIHGSKAKMLVDQRASVANEKVKSLEDKKTEIVGLIWTSTTMAEALVLLDEVKGE